MTDKAILKDFEFAGRTASYHYADDTGGEWGLGDAAHRRAMDLYHQNPQLQAAMLEISKKFLWSLKNDLKAQKYRRTLIEKGRKDLYFQGG